MQNELMLLILCVAYIHTPHQLAFLGILATGNKLERDSVVDLSFERSTV